MNSFWCLEFYLCNDGEMNVVCPFVLTPEYLFVQMSYELASTKVVVAKTFRTLLGTVGTSSQLNVPKGILINLRYP